MKTIQELVPLIHQWAKERKIYEELTPFDELLKTHEEVGELIKACYDNDKPAIQDAIGDVLVTLINYCYMVEQPSEYLIYKGLVTFKDTNISCILYALEINGELTALFHDVYFTKGKDSLTGYFNVIRITKYLRFIAESIDSTPEECLNIAYNEIKNRKGMMINGKFVKDE